LHALSIAIALDAIVRVAAPSDGALADRVRGQIADLDVELTTDAAPLETTLPAQLAKADALAKQHAARAVVVWFLTRPDGVLVVCVSEPRAGRVLVRELGRPESGELSSATLEQAALVVRNALRALAAGGTIGVERSVYEPPPPPPPVVKARAIEAPSKPHAAASATGFGGVGARASLDGLFGTSAAWLWLGIGWRSFEVRLDASIGAPTDAVSSYATLHVARHTFALAASADLLRGRTLDFAIGGRAGGTVYVRTTPRTDPTLAAAPRGVTGAGLVGVETRLRWRPTEGAWALVAAAGVDFTLGAPTFGVNAPTFVHLETPAVVEPWLALGIEFDPIRRFRPSMNDEQR